MAQVKSPEDPATARLGCYAGPVTRLAAWIVDLFVSQVLLAVIIVTVIAIVDFVDGEVLHIQVSTAGAVPAEAVWLFLYYFVCWASVGKTPGMRLLGIKVVRRDGSRLHAGKAAVRTLVFPFSFILGLGLVGIVVGREHRALHDVAASTTVVYD
jgi:uncharacterized RDD family membrane protein YckC